MLWVCCSRHCLESYAGASYSTAVAGASLYPPEACFVSMKATKSSTVSNEVESAKSVVSEFSAICTAAVTTSTATRISALFSRSLSAFTVISSGTYTPRAVHIRGTAAHIIRPITAAMPAKTRPYLAQSLISSP